MVTTNIGVTVMASAFDKWYAKDWTALRITPDKIELREKFILHAAKHETFTAADLSRLAGDNWTVQAMLNDLEKDLVFESRKGWGAAGEMEYRLR
jgi:hypothetical protein